jgi:anti-sigma regulatory factor (Ser/Thr protein kinase)
LIEYTREIQERCKLAATEAVKNAGIDFEYMVELELEYDKTITVSFDEGALYREIESLIDDTFETDDDSVFDEATNVITFMSKR